MSCVSDSLLFCSHFPDHPEHQDGHVKWHYQQGRGSQWSQWWRNCKCHRHHNCCVPAPKTRPWPIETFPELCTDATKQTPKKPGLTTPPLLAMDPWRPPAFIPVYLCWFNVSLLWPSHSVLPVKKPYMCLSLFTCSALAPLPCLISTAQEGAESKLKTVPVITLDQNKLICVCVVPDVCPRHIPAEGLEVLTGVCVNTMCRSLTWTEYVYFSADWDWESTMLAMVGSVCLFGVSISVSDSGGEGVAVVGRFLSFCFHLWLFSGFFPWWNAANQVHHKHVSSLRGVRGNDG